jgi:hypothetical protein
VSAVLEHAVDLPAPPGFDGNQKKEDARPPTSASSSNRARDTGRDVKIPKWLKLGSSKSLSIRRPCLPCNFLTQRSDTLHPDGIIQSPLPPFRGTVLYSSCSSCCTHCRNTVTLDLADCICYHLNYVHMYSNRRYRLSSVNGKPRVYVARPCGQSTN